MPANPDTTYHVVGVQRDDHPQYARTDGTRAFTGAISGTSASFSGAISAASVSVNGAQVMPPGIIQEYAGSSVPAGWLTCDGSAVSRTTYAALFAAISTTWGAGDGSTTFNLPDFRGRNTIGAGTGSGLTARSLAQTGGEETHTLTFGEIPGHTHSTNARPPDGSTTGSFFISSHQTTQGLQDVPVAPTGGSSSPGGGSHNTMQPFAVVTKIIKT